MREERRVGTVEETWALAAEFAGRLRGGDVVCMDGDLGAGKTTFTQGLAAAMGAKRAVTSPTFCLVSEYATEAGLLVHMDLYRLQGADDVLAIGWEEYLARGAVVVVEWPERAEELIPADAWRVSIRHCEGGEERVICISREG